MPFEKLMEFTKKVSDLADRPNAQGMTAVDLRAHFDAAPDEVRQYLNKLVDALHNDTAAGNIGVAPITGVDGITVQAMLESLKGIDDANYNYFQSQLAGIILGQVPDGSVSEAKLSFDPATQLELNQHTSDSAVHKTSSQIRAESTTNLVVEVRTTDPTSPVTGRIWLRSDL